MDKKKPLIFITAAGGIAIIVLIVALIWPKKPIGEVLPTGIPVEGPATSTVTIVEFLDFQCPACGAFYPIMKRIREEYAGKIRFAERQMILPEIHEYAKGASIAAVCAGKQDKYFEYADALMVNQSRLGRDDLIRYADALHLNMDLFNKCLDDPAVADFVVEERKAGEALGIIGTPWLFINRDSIEGTPTYEVLKKLIDDRLKQEVR
ncbi:MAG: thioredoxin domain-containing protein [Patescibacteria group bacterium]